MSDNFRAGAPSKSYFDFDSSTLAIVTGANGKVGSVIERSLLECGVRVLAVDQSSRTTSEEKNSNYVQADLSGPEGIARVLDAVDRPVSLLVNCAALTNSIEPSLTALDLVGEFEDFSSYLNLNLVAPFLLTRRIYREGIFGKYSSVVNIASIYGVVGPTFELYEGTSMALHPAYAASKAGLINVTKFLSVELAPEVRVNAVSPGGILRNQPYSFTERYLSIVPMRSMLSENDVLGAVAYLSSHDMAGAVTGHNLIVDGGWTVK